MFNTVLICLIMNYSTFTHQSTVRTALFRDVPWRELQNYQISANLVILNMHPYNFEYAEYEYESNNKIFALFHIEIVNFSNGPVGA